MRHSQPLHDPAPDTLGTDQAAISTDLPIDATAERI